MAELLSADLAPAEAVRHFESKGYQVGFAWQDVWQEEHARAFTVAKAMRLDILEDIRREVDNSIRNGITFETFKANLKPVLKAKGWWGKGPMLDPVTGLTEEVQLGSNRRLKTIFDTNLRTSYAAGQWERIERVKETRPFLRYVSVQDERTRPQHRAWHGTIRRVDDPWWSSHYPPNGWNCRCSVQQLSQRDMERRGYKVTEDPPSAPPVRRVNRRTGEVVEAPAGIDIGWNYNVGKAHMRAFTPSALNAKIFTVFNKPNRAATTMPTTIMNRPAGLLIPPKPSRVSSSILLPKGTDARSAKEAFFGDFGTTPEVPVVFLDKLGEPLAIDDALFTDIYGGSKLAQGGSGPRRQNIRLLALTIREPDEIWWVWEQPPGRPYRLRRRYFKWFTMDGRNHSGLAAFDVGKNGWTGVTTFTASTKSYLERQRGGTLAYRRLEE